LLKKATVVAETSDNHIFSQWQPFNSFLPIFNMPGYTPNIFKVRFMFGYKHIMIAGREFLREELQMVNKK